MDENRIVYQSFSYEMIHELLKNENTPAWIRIWLYLSMFQKKSKKPIYASNQYISEHLNIPFGTVKYSITKLRDKGFISIQNAGTFKRKISLTHLANIVDSDYSQLKADNEMIRHRNMGKHPITEYVYLSDNEMAQLLELMGEVDRQKYINDLDRYIAKTHKEYASHYETLVHWWKKNGEQRKSKKKLYDEPQEQWDTEFKNDLLYRNQMGTYKFDNDKNLTELYEYDWLNDSQEDEIDEDYLY